MAPTDHRPGDLSFRSRQLVLAALLTLPGLSAATPANKAALVKHYDSFLAKSLNACTTCHLPGDKKNPESLAEFPHNPFGDRLRAVKAELDAAQSKTDIPARLMRVATEDADRDGVDNQTELLLGHNPGNAKDRPTPRELSSAKKRAADFARHLASYRWEPFDPVNQPAVPQIRDPKFAIRNPVDAFIAAEHAARKLTPRPEAPREVLLRRVYLDLIGLAPTPEEVQAFLADRSPDAYEKVVDRLLERPEYGERWGRHWMDVWRYSDWTGYQNVPRDSKPHIWRWRDWIIESLNADKGYDRMIAEMLAADELAPEDRDAVRATGFLARNFKLLSREKWLEDTIGHTFQAFLGVTMNCAKCHDHMYDPISQQEYYEVRAIFEPHNVRTDRVPGQTNTAREGDGLVRVFDAAPDATTHFLHRGDERQPDTNRVITPNVPRVLGDPLQIQPVSLPLLAYRPDKLDFVVEDDLAASEKALLAARQALEKLKTAEAAKNTEPTAAAAASTGPGAKKPATSGPKTVAEAREKLALAEARHAALTATVRAERLEADRDSPDWKQAAQEAVAAQRKLAVIEAREDLRTQEAAVKTAQSKADKDAEGGDKEIAEKSAKDLEAARKKLADAGKALATADQELTAPPGTAYQPRKFDKYPDTSTGRRLALARWIASPENPLTARVAMNHIWARHFGRGIVPTLNEFGSAGRPPTHPQLLDWLAAEFMGSNWSMKHLHRLIVTSSAYRMASTPDAANAQLDPDNVWLWRMPSRRMEAELVRDNLLHVAGALDRTLGGPDIDHKLGLSSRRRSVYLRIAPEKEVEFLKIFDGPNPVECYERKPTVMPHHALALANNEMSFAQSHAIASELAAQAGADDARFIRAAYERVLSRKPTRDEAKLCSDFLKEQTANGRSADGPSASLLDTTAMKTVANAKSTGANPLPVDKAARTSRPRSDSSRARENLVLVLFNHNDFVTIR
jgi:hypothetical protein